MECSDLKRRFERAKENRYNIEGVWELIERFVLPFRGRFFTPYMGELEIDWRKRELFDSTAVVENQKLASNIHSGLTNPVVQWFDFITRDKVLMKNQEVVGWLQIAAYATFMALQESNFNMEANECYLDLTSFGASVVVEEGLENQDGSLKEIDFSAVPIVECFFEQDEKGQVLYFYRRLQWTAVQIKSKFGDQTPEDILEKAKGAAEDRIEVIYAIYPRWEKIEADTFSVLPPTERPWGYKYFTSKDAVRLGDEGGYYEMPAFVPRWRKTTGSMWGHSPAMTCLSDILTLNQLVEMILKAAEKVIDPPILTTRRGVFGDIDLEAAGVTVVQNLDALKPFESGARFDVSQLEKTELQRSIRAAFFSDQLQLKESPAMTATEVNARFELMSRLMGPTLSRLQYDFLNPLVQRTFMILFRYRMLPPPPAALLESGSELDIEYLGPMSKAQKQDKAISIERWLGSVSALGEAYPEALDIPNIDEAAKELGNLGGVPANIINSAGTINMKRTQRRQMQENERKLAMMEQGANVAKTGAEAGAIMQEGGKA